jgi:hypothetical protein
LPRVRISRSSICQSVEASHAELFDIATDPLVWDADGDGVPLGDGDDVTAESTESLETVSTS